jgi:hypothetical protein
MIFFRQVVKLDVAVAGEVVAVFRGEVREHFYPVELHVFFMRQYIKG